LPSRPNATIRSPAAAWFDALIEAGHGTIASLRTRLVRAGMIVRNGNAATPTGRDKAGSFAPFVYRLGRHPFTVERAVRFR
jgi:hypothetical protein